MNIVNIILHKNVIGPIVIIGLFILIYMILKNIIKNIAHKKIGVNNKRKKTLMSLFNNMIKYFFIFLAIIMILNIYGINTTAFVTSLGIVGIVTGLAIQDILKDFLSGITIIVENQYAVGDVVTINGFKGEVTSLGIKTTKIKSSLGEIKFIANRNIVEVTNHSLSNALAIVDITLPNLKDIDQLETVLETLATRLNKEIKYLKGNIELLGIDQFTLTSLIYRITVATQPSKNKEVERILKKEIKKELDKHKDLLVMKDE